MASDPPARVSSPELRASDGEREEAVRRLRDGAADRRLTLDELAGRVEQAYQTTTRTELARLTGDLASPIGQQALAVTARRRWAVSLIGGTHRDGRFRFPARSVTVSLIRGAYLDLREAELDGPEVEITQVSLIGGAHVIVPDGVHVEVSGVSVIGGHHVEAPSHLPGPAAPVVHIRDFSLIGGVNVSRPSESPPSSSRRARRDQRRADRRLRRG